MKHNGKDWHGTWFFCKQSRFATKSFCYPQSSILQRMLLPPEVDLQLLQQDNFSRKRLCSKTTSQQNGQYPEQVLSLKRTNLLEKTSLSHSLFVRFSQKFASTPRCKTKYSNLHIELAQLSTLIRYRYI